MQSRFRTEYPNNVKITRLPPRPHLTRGGAVGRYTEFYGPFQTRRGAVVFAKYYPAKIDFRSFREVDLLAARIASDPARWAAEGITLEEPSPLPKKDRVNLSRQARTGPRQQR